jgi:hypothetical protein
MKKLADGTSVRDYKAQQKYDGKPSVIKDRATRNAARAAMVKAGKVKKGDGKDVAHKKALSKGGKNTLANLFAQSSSGNKSFSRKKDGSMASEVSKRERKKK